MNIILNKSNILSFNFLNNLLITMFLLLKKNEIVFLKRYIFFITINLFDYRKLCFIQIIAYINENVLYIIDDIFCFYNIKTFSNNNVINSIRVKAYMRMKIFICIKERYIRKG